MDIGIGLPSYVPDAHGANLLAWAKRAEERGFSSLGTIDRLVYPIFSPLIALAAAAAVTQRIRLVTTVLLSPLHNGAILAKQAASLDALSNGRFVLGLGVGARENDFATAGVDYHKRGKIMDEQLAQMRRMWAGGSGQQETCVPPLTRQGPEVLIGGFADAAVERAARYGDGFVSSGGTRPEAAPKLYAQVREAWQRANRPGKPRMVACTYFALGEDVIERSRQNIVRYYGQQFGQRIVQGLLISPDAIKQAIAAYEQAGADEVILWPEVSDLALVDALADVVGK